MVEITEIKRKIVILGDQSVGKTSLIRKFVLDQFDDSYLATFGTKSTKKRITFRKKDNSIINLTLIIWDIMGQKEFKKIQTMAYNGAQAAFIICDITRKDTLFSIGFWQLELYNITGEIPIIILANKSDLKDKAKFYTDDLDEVSKDLNAPYFLTSAKTGDNVQKAFNKMGYQTIKKFLDK